VIESQEFLRLAGDPLRWRLLTELARSDLHVQELTGLLDRPQNLVSYHLGKLRSAGLVSARRSSADARGTYYTVDLGRFGELLAQTGRAVHPGCGWLRPHWLRRHQRRGRRRGCCSCAPVTVPGPRSRRRWR
jgi:ArsR family transcriptional regulator, arsenate/arsenite/antimonite-responsive transcriptional repressor / arsenate reductase (thioredoxin)